METVSLSRSIEAPESAVRDLVTDVGPFMESAGFDDVVVDGDTVTITNHVGLLTIELELRVIETDHVLAYEQIEGVFDEMVTRYTLAETPAGVEIEATTEYALDVDLVGSILDSTIIARQRKRELSSQFDALQDETGADRVGE